jgi:hypothetical protein
MGSPLHGINGLIYIGGTELTGGNSWSLNLPSELAEARQFGDSWVTRDKGVNDWSGNITAYNHLDSKLIATAATASAHTALLLYPDRNTLTAYYSGNAFFGMQADTGTGGMSNRNGDFSGNGALTITGFA